MTYSNGDIIAKATIWSVITITVDQYKTNKQAMQMTQY